MELGNVRVKIEGDQTKLQADLKAAEAAAANAGGKIAEAFNRSAGSIKDAQNAVKAATLNMTEAAKAFGPAAATGNKAAVSSLKLYETELKTAQAELARFTKQQATAPSSAGKPPSFVGAIPGFGVAAERFIGMVPGLGDTLTSLFPLFGATAFLAVIDRIGPKILEAADAFDPMTRATERAKKAAEDYDDVIKKLGADIKELNADAIEFAVGKSAAGAIGSAEKTQDQRASQGIVKLLRDELAQYQAIAKAKLAAANAPANPYDEGGGQLLVAAKESKAANLDVETARKRLTAFEAQAAKDEAEASQKIRKSLVQGVDDRKKAADESSTLSQKATQRENEGYEARYRMFEEALKETKAARDRDLADEKRYQDAMAEQQQRWKRINIDAASPDRFQQAKIDVPLMDRLPSSLANKMDLNKAGVLTTDQRERDIALDQELLTLAQSINVPLGTQLNMREQILQKQIDLKAAQGQSVSADLQALDALQSQMDQMHQKAAGIAPMLHNLRGIGGTIPGQLGGALAGGIVGGNPGKGIGQEIRGALQGIGQQILGTVFQRAIQQMVTSLSLNTLGNTLLRFIFGTSIPVQAANTVAVSANTVGQGVLTVSNGVLTAAVIALTASVAYLATIQTITSFFADGGRPPLGVPSIVGERGPEMFIPDQAGKIVPNHQLAGGAGLMLPMMAAIASNSVGSMNFHAHGMTNPREFVREVARQLPAYLKSTNAKYSPAAR